MSRSNFVVHAAITITDHSFPLNAEFWAEPRNTENIELSLSQILPVNLVDRLYLSVAVTGDKYCIFG